MKFKYFLFVTLIGTYSVFFISCKKDEVDPQVKMNTYIKQWMYSVMSDVYFWNTEIPPLSSLKNEPDPKDFYHKLLKTPEDRWSWLTEDYPALEAELDGMPTSMGISPIPGKFSNSDNVFIIVSYVYPNSPADRAGLKRGDIILKIDGQDLDTLNYSALFNMKSYSITLGEYQDSAIYPTTKIIPLTAEIIDSNPIVFDTILQYNNQKIAYMVYAEFISGKNSSLLNKFGLKMFEFKSQGVTDLIVDLRYNPGGEIIAANYIASCIAPLNVVYSNSVLVNFQYNSIYQNYFLSTEGPDSKYLVNRMVYNGYNLNLNRVFFLTGTRTASASELLITGLQPYMDVFKIGEQTYGKYTGAWVIQDTNKPPKHKWAIVPIVSKYSNSVGFTDFVDGLAPEYFVRDNLLQAKQFGDVNDPALGTAVEIITGQPLVIKKNSSSELNYHMLEGNSNPIKYNLYLENPVFVY